MLHRIIPFVVITLLINAIIGIEVRSDEVLQIFPRYMGATGPSITAFDDRTDRWLAEMQKETIEVTLQKLTDAVEYYGGLLDSSGGIFVFTEEGREETGHRKDIRTILSNRRFRKAFEDLQKIDKKEAAKLLTKHIRINLKELRVMLEKDIEKVSQGRHTGVQSITLATRDPNSTRPMSHPDYPPSHLGRKFAVQSYVWLAALLELRDARPAVEEVIQLAKDEYTLFDSLSTSVEEISFKEMFYKQTIYNPSLLVTSTLCDPAWNVEKRKQLEKKLVTRRMVDYRSRAIESDILAVDGSVPVIPDNQVLELRYYQGITDEEFNTFFN